MPIEPRPWRATLLGALALGAVLCAPASAEERAPRVRLEISAPERIVQGDRFSLRVTVRLSPPNGLPLLLTPSSEGTAIEVVRGRLLRADAEDPKADPLVFRVPLVARGAGTSVVRVRVLAYTCRSLCHELRADRSLTLRVLSSP